jgi:hypothetical protein
MKELTNNKNTQDKNFNEIQFSSQKVSGKEFYNCHFKSCDFSETVFVNCEFNHCQFIECNLNNIDVNNSKFIDVEFNNCKIMGVNWTMAYWRDFMLSAPLTFTACMINSSSFYGLNIEKLTVERCRSHDVDFREANLIGVNFSYTDLKNSLFNNTNLTDANFLESENYDINVKNNTVNNASFCRYEAVSLLTSLGINLLD